MSPSKHFLTQLLPPFLVSAPRRKNPRQIRILREADALGNRLAAVDAAEAVSEYISQNVVERMHYSLK